MTDDELLQALGKLERASEGAPDGQFARLCAGALSVDEQSELQERAARDPELAEQVHAYTPLDAALRARIATQAMSALKAQAGVPAIEPRSRIVAAPRRARVATRTALGLLAAAAACLFFFVERETPGALPRYAMELSGGMATQRGPSAPAEAKIVLAASTRLQVLLRPATSVDDATEVAAYLATSDGALKHWSFESERSSSGTVRLLLGPPPHIDSAGAELRLVVGRPEVLGDSSERLARAGPAQGPGYQRFVVALSLVP